MILLWIVLKPMRFYLFEKQDGLLNASRTSSRFNTQDIWERRINTKSRTIRVDEVGKAQVIARRSRKGRRVTVSYKDTKGNRQTFRMSFNTQNTLEAMDKTEEAFRMFAASQIASQMKLSAV